MISGVGRGEEIKGATGTIPEAGCLQRVTGRREGADMDVNIEEAAQYGYTELAGVETLMPDVA